MEIMNSMLYQSLTSLNEIANHLLLFWHRNCDNVSIDVHLTTFRKPADVSINTSEIEDSCWLDKDYFYDLC